jgi:hypothetical protein
LKIALYWQKFDHFGFLSDFKAARKISKLQILNQMPKMAALFSENCGKELLVRSKILKFDFTFIKNSIR